MFTRKFISFSVLSIFVVGANIFTPQAQAADLVFCVNKSSRVVTYPASGKCASSAITLNLVSNDLRQPKSHTTTAAIVPKTSTLKVLVPNVLAMDKTQATSVLTNSGLRVVFKMVKSGPNAKVIQVVPKVGSQVAGGSVVALVLG
jgi:hypothetical protein